MTVGGLRDAALRYAAAGWPVFPCTPGSKVPLYASPHPPGSDARRSCRGECGRWGHGVLDATTDPAVITVWWQRTPAANVGVATGAPGPDVVDVDTKHDAPGPASYTRLRAAGLLRGARAVVVTPSGGWHLYYPGSGQGNSSRPRHGIDFRGHGGYVLVPPSVVDGRVYELTVHRPQPCGAGVDWAAIRDFLDPPRAPQPRAGGAHGDSRGLAGFGSLVRWLEQRPAGDRNNALYWAARRAVEAGADQDILDQLREAIVRAGHDAAAAERTVRSAARRAGAAR